MSPGGDDVAEHPLAGSGGEADRRSSAVPDTIVARATPSGVGAVAVVRLSGARAFEILDRLAPGLERRPEPRRATLAGLRDPDTGELLDRGLVTLFPGPASYTGEDVVELSGHGGFLAPALILEACLALGARRAEPGEFTHRAYLNGKMDLVQAEAVLDLVEGRNRALHGAALHQLDRGLSDRLAALRDDLVELEALLTHHIDFPDEDEPPVPRSVVAERAREVVDALERLVATAPEGELLREGAVTVLAGRPNTGKSSLFNALTGQDRAIVTEVPGTTRDALEAVVSLEGFPFRLVDTAGLRESDDRVERLGIEVARRYLEGADVVLLCAEAGRPLEASERRFAEATGAPVVLVRTKVDRVEGEVDAGADATRSDARGPGGSRDAEGVDDGEFAGELDTSAHSGRGLGGLRKFLPELVYRGLTATEGRAPVITRRRHARGVRRALREVKEFAEALESGVPAEMAATHLHPAETALEEVLGVISPDDVLERVFGRFCIGK